MAIAIPIPQSELIALCQRYRITRLSLFGSVTRADFGPDSDVDILVEFAPDVPVGFLTMNRLARELAEVLRRPVDLVPRNGLKPAIRDAILREEQVIYAA
ncbi:nucleotidyltransferase family protein [Thermosynechococcus sp. FA-CM-4201]